MLYANILLLLLILITVFDKILSMDSLLRLKRQTKCEKAPRLKIKGCKLPQSMNLYIYYQYYQSVEVIAGCPGNAMESIIWSLYYIDEKKDINMDKFKNKVTVSFPPKKLKTGDYFLKINAVENNGKPAMQLCKLHFMSEPPVLIFKYGQQRRVPVGQVYEVDLTGSINYDKKNALKPEIGKSCNSTMASGCPATCTVAAEGKGEGMKFSLRTEKCQKAHTLVATVKHEGIEIKTYQIVNIVPGFVESDVVCEKNCDGAGSKYTNPALPTILKFVCYTNCTDVVPTGWKLVNNKNNEEIPKSNYKVLENNRVIIPPNTLARDVTYAVSCIIYGGTNRRMIQTIPEIKVPNCDIQPRSGESLKTVFTVKCTTTGHLAQYAPFYQLYQDEAVGTKKGAMLAASSFGEFDLVVASIKDQPKQKLIVLGHDPFFNKFKLSLPEITVQPADLSGNALKSHLDKIDKLYQDGNGELAAKYIQGLLSELGDSNVDVAIRNSAFSRLITSMNKMEMDSASAYKQLVTLLPHFYKSEDLDADIKEQLSDFCKMLSEVELSSLLTSDYAEFAEADVKQSASYTKTCADALIEPEEEEIEIHVTTPDYVVSESFVEENYVNYDNIFVSSEVERMKNNAMNTILTSSRAVAATLATGQYYNKKHEHFESAIITNQGKLWPGKDITVNSTVIKIISNDKKFAEDSVAAIVTGYKRDFLQSNDVKLDSNIVDVNFLVTKGQTQTSVPTKIEISLDIEMNIDSESFNFTVSRFEKNWLDHITINVHRLETKRGRQYLCKFDYLKTTDKFKMVVVVGRRPHLDDFKEISNTYLIDGSKLVPIDINFSPNREGDIFTYIGILPHQDMLKGSENVFIDYNITLVEEACLVFNQTTFSWEQGPCEAKLINEESSKRIQCTCMHTSLYGANLNSVDNKIDYVHIIEFTTRGFKNYTILICVSIIFAFYCVALCFYQMRYTVMGGKDRVYFLSDNLKNDRYGYLVIVKTGSINNSGTTSNVAFKLLGEKFSCKPHVFNYPDPQKRLLQIGTTDCYVLSTDRHMGKIEEIHLWFDSIGLRPSWYCERITVIDLQNQDYYYFIVEKWLSVLHSERIQIKVKSTKNVYEASKDVTHHIRKCVRVYAGAFHTWNIVNRSHDHLFAYNERLTVIVSMIYTTYVFNLLFLYVPTMHMSDIYGYGQVKVDIYIVASAIGGSLLSCLMNYPFIFFFRNSEKNTKNVLLITTPTLYSTRVNAITWAVIAIYIIICVGYLTIFGFWVNFDTTMIWLIDTTISLVMSIIIVDNLYIIGMRMILLKLKQFHVEIANITEIIKLAEKQRRILFRKFGEVLLRPYFKKHYRILRRDDVTMAQSRETARLDVGELFKEMCLFIIFVFILYFILLADMDYMIYYSNSQMRTMISTNTKKKSITLHSIDDIYNYINDTILPVVHAVNWYGKYNSLDPGQMKDFKTKILGVVQLRQQRMNQKCMVPYAIANLSIICHNNAPIFNNWTYYDGSEISHTLGNIQLYTGKGYTTLLGRTLYNSYYILALLKRSRWIDINTKVLLIEYWTYNVNFNIFNAVRIIIERSRSGYIITSINVATARFIQSNFVMEVLIIIGVFTIIAIVLIMLIKRIIRMIKRRLGFFKSFWNLVDLLLLILSAAIITLFFIKRKILDEIIYELFASDKNEFINYFNLFLITETNMIFSSLLLGFSTIKLWKYLRFGTIFQEMETTVKLCSGPMLIAFLYYFWTAIMFGRYFHLMLGTKVEKFSTYAATIYHLISSIVDVQRIKKYKPFMDDITYNMFLFYDLMVLTFTTIFLTIIIWAFQESKNYYSNRANPYTIKEYFLDEAKYLTEVSKTQYERLRGGQDEDNIVEEEKEEKDVLVYPKEKSKLYADSIYLTKPTLKLMQIITLAVIKNVQRINRKSRKSLKDADYELLARIVIRMYKSNTETTENKIIFIVGEDPDTNKVKLVEFSKLIEMEIFTIKLLHGFQEEEAYEDKQMIIHMPYEKRLDGIKETIDMLVLIISHIKLV